ncbi:hypothetical protein N0A02_29290 [Paraburkholderia acidicola]|uniref:Uncharacterized protein n=1 Tax=Paraburkholderia acidicola TaxID=1912599 RepID=A0ABV1LW96_9BURK
MRYILAAACESAVCKLKNVKCKQASVLNPERYIDLLHTLWNGTNRWKILADQVESSIIGVTRQQAAPANGVAPLHRYEKREYQPEDARKDLVKLFLADSLKRADRYSFLTTLLIYRGHAPRAVDYPGVFNTDVRDRKVSDGDDA